MSGLNIPIMHSCCLDSPFVMSIEGCNGAGKTTLLEAYSKQHQDVECSLCVPSIYQTARDMKHFMLFESSAMCRALYYLGGAIEMRQRHNASYDKVLLDRSVWSTFAAAYGKDAKILGDLFACLNILGNYLFIPEKVVVLETSYETCRRRISQKDSGGEFDKDDMSIFNKKMEFYHLLRETGYDIDFINTDALTKEQVLQAFSKIAKPYFDQAWNDRSH